MSHFKSEFFLLFTLITFVVVGCGSSTGTRYDNGNNNTIKKSSESRDLKENFDITPYKTKIEIKQKSRTIDLQSVEAWYDYNNNSNNSTNSDSVINTVNGFRVRVISTDDLAQADSLRAELYGTTNQKHIYIIFDPPFYRIEVGDFTDISAANDLKFKLNQLGYGEARVINEKVNIYQ